MKKYFVVLTIEEVEENTIISKTTNCVISEEKYNEINAIINNEVN